MVRGDKTVKRHVSLDSTDTAASAPFRLLRRQNTEESVKVAWGPPTIPEPQEVEIVAKRYGQPKPVAPVRPSRSPLVPDEGTVLLSRQRLTERLLNSWQGRAPAGGRRHNLDIFISQGTAESESADEDISLAGGVVDSEDEPEASPSPAPTPKPAPAPLSASDRRKNFRAMGRQTRVSESVCPTPEPTMPPSSPSTPVPGNRTMSAPTRPRPKKSASVDCPTLASTRVKSAPPKRKYRGGAATSSGRRKTDEEKSGGRRGVEKANAEVVTMVSLVSPAGSEDEEESSHPGPLPPTPLPPATPPLVPNPPPPAIIPLRRPAKAVTFRPLVPTAQYQTSFPLKRTSNGPIHQKSVLGAGPAQQPRPPLLRRASVAAPTPRRPLKAMQCIATPSLLKDHKEDAKPVTPPPPPPPLPEPPPQVIQPTQDQTEDAGDDSKESGPRTPRLHSSKEKECWRLFKKMSESGVSVSFDTVLRGLLTPTEYRVRKAAVS